MRQKELHIDFERAGELCALMVLDVDNFKEVYDTFGHAVGNSVLVDVSNKLKTAFGDQIIGRIGGDEKSFCRIL